MAKKKKTNTEIAVPENHYLHIESDEKSHNPNYKRHLITVPFRMIVIAFSSGGKTNFLYDLISQMNNTFEEIVICVPDKHEPLYQDLEKRGKGMIIFHDEKSIPNLEEFKDKRQRLIVFDDLVVFKKIQPIIAEYYIRGRHFNLSMAYLSQDYYNIPKIVRQQANYLVLKKINSAKDYKMILREWASELDAEQLVKLYRECTDNTNNVGFLMICGSCAPELKYRANYTPIDMSPYYVF